MYKIETAYGTITCSNADTLLALKCALYDAEDWNLEHDYDGCAAENRAWINTISKLQKK